MSLDGQIGKEVLDNTVILENTILVEGSEILNNIKNDIDFSEKLSELHRLKSTLLQYINKSSDLEYIAFVGHFSSGKSSTINTLLNLWGSNSKRNTSQQPTDTAITLITHPQNSSSLIGSHKKGELIVNSKEIESNHLTNKVIIDTPGSGDPNILNEMVKDYLAMCDRVIYTLTAAVPLDNNDIPILQKAFKELPFIPLKFIITRADEFIDNIDNKFSENNISQGKIDKFVSELIARLENAIPEKSFNTNDFLFIDNLHNYNTEAIQDYIFNERKHEIHEHKIKYFVTNLKEIREFFYTFILEQEKSLNDLVASAEANHEKFKEIATLEKDKIETLWSDCFTELTSKQTKLESSINNIIKNTDVATKASETTSFCYFDKNISNEIGDSANEISKRIFQEIEIQSSKILSDLKSISRKIINQSKLGEIKFDEIKPQNNYSISIEDIEFPKHLSRSIKSLSQSIGNDIDVYRLNNISALDQVINHINNNSYTKIEDSLAEKSTDHLAQVLDKHFKYVDLYRTAILAKNGMQLAEKLKLGEAIDKLDQAVLSDSYKKEIKNEVVKQLYGNRTSNRTKFIENIQNLKKSILELKRSAPINDNLVNIPKSNLKENIDSEYENLFKLSEFSDDVSKNIKSIIIRHQKEHREEVEQEYKSFRKKVIRKLVTGLSIGAIIAILTPIFFSDFFQTEVFSSLISNELTRALIVQLLIVILTTSASFVFGNYRSIHKENINNIPKSRKNKLLDDIDLLQPDVFNNKENSKKALILEIEERLKLTINHKVNGVLEQQNTQLTTILKFSEQVKEKISSYEKESSNYLERSKKIYVNTDNNIKGLNLASNKIRDKAIEPSFALFKTRKNELSTLSKKIKAIEFI